MCECVDECVEFGIGDGPVDVSVALGQLTGEIVAAEEDLQGPSAADYRG